MTTSWVLTGSPSEVKETLAVLRSIGYDPKVIFFKMLDAWTLEAWYV